MDDGFILRGWKLANGRTAGIVPLTFGRARIGLNSEGIEGSFDDVW